MNRKLISVSVAGLLLSGCALSRGPATTARPGAIDAVSQAVLAAGWLETPLALDNDRLVSIEAHAMATVRSCGERLESLSGKAEAEKKGPVASAVGLLVASLAFGAATGLTSLAPDGEPKDIALGAIAVTGTAVLGVTAATGIARAVSSDGSAARRTGEIKIALAAFGEDWQEVLANPVHSCFAEPGNPDPLRESEHRAPYAMIEPEKGPGARCLDQPVRGQDGAEWVRMTAFDALGEDLNRERCVLASAGQAALERDLRERVMRLERRCLAPLDKLPPQPPVEPAPEACG